MTILEKIIQNNEDHQILIADGFDNAVIGYDIYAGRLIYQVSKCIEILMDQGMSESDAVEYFNFNVADAYVGEQTPIFCFDLW